MIKTIKTCALVNELCLGEEEYLKIVFEDFFVDRLGVEECKKKIRAVYDYISSPAYFNYIEPVYDYILYKVRSNSRWLCRAFSV